jgi:4-coumarate--CoA ligase
MKGAQEMAHPLKEAEVKYLFVHPDAVKQARKGLELAGISSKNGTQPRIWLLSDNDDMTSVQDGSEKDLRTLLEDSKLEEPIVIKDAKERTALVCFSSGTSGKPKGVELTHRNMTSVIAAMDRGLEGDYNVDDITLAVLPFQHIFGLAKFLLRGFQVGLQTIVMPKFDLQGFLEGVQRYKVTQTCLVPPICVLLAKHPLVSKYDLSTLKHILVGAAPLSADLGDQVTARLPTVVITQGYGLTETSPTATYGSMERYKYHKGTCGALVPCVEARLVDDDGKDVGHEQGQDGKPGELWLKGSTIMKGYLNNKAATDDCITPDGWFKTGDVAIVKKGFFYIVDRKKELIKYKGFQVAPAELEAHLLSNEKVADAAVLGVYVESQATELPRAYIVPRDEHILKDEKAMQAFSKEIQQWFDGQSANHKKLRGGVRVVAQIEKSPSGKILRRVYRDQHDREAKEAK